MASTALSAEALPLPIGIPGITDGLPPGVQIWLLAAAGVGMAIAAGLFYLRSVKGSGGREAPGSALGDLRLLGAALNDSNSLKAIADELREWRSVRAVEAEKEKAFRGSVLTRLDALAEAIKAVAVVIRNSKRAGGGPSKRGP